MGKLFKFLKPYAAAVAAIICILVVQAYCDLSLPTYTSDIVNVGIQQGGIDEALPDTISKKDLNHLLLLVPSDRQKIVKNAYTESVEKYDYNGTVMELKASVKEDKKKVDRLSEILGKPMLMAAGFDSGSEMTQKIEEQMRTQMSGIPNVDKMDIYDMLEFMGAEGRNALIGQMDQQMDSMQDSIIAQAAAGYIKDVYTHIGIDTDQIETTYILHTGAKMLALAFLGMAASILTLRHRPADDSDGRQPDPAAVGQPVYLLPCAGHEGGRGLSRYAVRHRHGGTHGDSDLHYPRIGGIPARCSGRLIKTQLRYHCMTSPRSLFSEAGGFLRLLRCISPESMFQ